MNDALLTHRICQAAVRIIEEKGYDEVSMTDIALAAAIDEAELYLQFGNKQDIIRSIYQSINTDWQLQVSDISEEKLADRFERALTIKADLAMPYATILANMTNLLLNNSKIGINTARTSHIRAIGLQTINTIIDGAKDCRTLKMKMKELPQMLYLIHWGILFLSLRSGNREKTQKQIKLVAQLLNKADKLSMFLNFSPLLNSMNMLVEDLSGNEIPTDYSADRELMKIIFNHRKLIDPEKKCLDNACETCMNQHEARIHFYTSQDKPLHFILPAFPAKSPNQAKVLGPLPDLGEEIALNTLESLCKEIQSVYKPGANITICSDGRIFSELVGVTDEQVTQYVNGIKAMINRLELQHIEIVNLEDLLDGQSFSLLREQVLTTYAEPLEDLKSKLATSAELTNLFNGIHRFITDDRKMLEPNKSATQVKNESKTIALKVIQHSNAWTRFLAYVYPNAIRLSIHPYHAHNSKIGIQITKADDNWLTPWHGVILLQENNYVLVKKSKAEEIGAAIVYKDKQPYYFALIPEK
jgi:pyoverdine/dityrosine biosynthesis protein Dit1/AcrR family transcriptional regulator